MPLSIRRRSLFIAGGLVAGVAVAEVVLRIVMAVPPPTRHVRVIDPLVHHRYRPHSVKIQETDGFRVEVRVSSRGFHDREFPASKAPGTFRIIVLGDSFTFGVGLRMEETPPKRLEELLRDCPRLHEVVNAGTPSYSPILEYVLLREVGLGLNPDLVVLNFDMSDVHDDFIRTAEARLDAQGLPLAVPHQHRLETALLIPPMPWLGPLDAPLRWSAVFQTIRKTRVVKRLMGRLQLDDPDRLAAHGLVGSVQYDVVAITREGTFPDHAAAWTLTRRYITGIRELARLRGAGFALVSYPYPHQVSASESEVGRRSIGIGPGYVASDRPFQILEAIGREEGFPVISLLSLFRERHKRDGPLFWRGDFHHNPRGAALLAEGTLCGLRRHGLLPACER